MNDCHRLQQGVVKRKFSLSLKQQHDENLNPLCKTSSRKVLGLLNKSNTIKRPFKDTNSSVPELVKKFKSGLAKPLETEYELVIEPPVGWSDTQAMLNGQDTEEKGPSKHAPVATLANLGNTCFLNSVLYTLRYAPRFLHNLHHLVWDLATVDQKLGSLQLKSSSLGRGASLVSATTRSWSSKDLLALPNTDDAVKSTIQIVTEKLHETYVSLRTSEARCPNAGDPPEPYAADAFLSALREVNSTFEGNRQQDAHELLVCILDNVRETCTQLRAKAARLQLQEHGDSNGISRSVSIEPESKNPLASLGKSWKKKKKMLTKAANERVSSVEEKTAKLAVAEEDARTKLGFDFVSEDFEGTMVLRTTCLECETVTERRQTMCDVSVPVAEQPPEQHDESELFRAAAVTSECLRDQNKYWCEQCLRYNEARRTVGYESLPRLLVMQLKRFSGGMEKITRHAPTPLLLSCFCESCSRRPHDLRSHSFQLWAIIMHLGATLSGGHYVAYVRAGVDACDRCERAADAAPPGGFARTFFGRARAQQGCGAADCCRVRSQEATWLHCDDDTVKPLSQAELEALLAPELRPAATPYLLFYLKSDVAEVG